MRLAALGVPLAGSRALRDAAQRLEHLETLPEIKTSGKEPRLLVRVATDKLTPPVNAISALVSGRAVDGHAGFAAGFAWPFAAGRAQLLAWIEQTKSKDIYVTGACAEAIVAALGKRARLLGPPHQMSLSLGEAS